MAKYCTIWGIKVENSEEHHYSIFDGIIKDEDAILIMGNRLKKEGFLFGESNIRIFPDKVCAVIYSNRGVYPHIFPTVEKKIYI